MYVNFFYCKNCGKIIAVVLETNQPTCCCNQTMLSITPNVSSLRRLESDSYFVSKLPRLTYSKTKIKIKGEA